MPDPPLVQLVYVSSAPRLFEHDELLDILRSSRRNNPAVGVTGALLYAGGNIMQVLEGPPDAVDAVYERVCRDPRHRNMIVLLRQEVAERTFPEWAMGFRHLDDLDPADRAAARQIADLTEMTPGRAGILLASFRGLLPGAGSTAGG